MESHVNVVWSSTSHWVTAGVPTSHVVRYYRGLNLDQIGVTDYMSDSFFSHCEDIQIEHGMIRVVKIDVMNTSINST